MRALAVDAEAVERRGMRRGEIAVGAAAGRCIDQIKTDLGRERPGVLVKRGARIALLVGRTVQLADHLDADAVGAGLQVEDFRHQFVGIGNRRHAHVDLGIGLLRDHVRLGAASDDADIDGDAALEIVHRFQRLDDVAEFADGAAAVLVARAGMRRHALDEDLEARDALAPGDDLAAVARPARSPAHISLCVPPASISAREVGLPISSSET